ncbi:hypothetical protein GGI35DRAFT_484942 [Trichoderma velutinum]
MKLDIFILAVSVPVLVAASIPNPDEANMVVPTNGRGFESVPEIANSAVLEGNNDEDEHEKIWVPIEDLVIALNVNTRQLRGFFKCLATIIS